MHRKAPRMKRALGAALALCLVVPVLVAPLASATAAGKTTFRARALELAAEARGQGEAVVVKRMVSGAFAGELATDPTSNVTAWKVEDAAGRFYVFNVRHGDNRALGMIDVNQKQAEITTWALAANSPAAEVVSTTQVTQAVAAAECEDIAGVVLSAAISYLCYLMGGECTPFSDATSTVVAEYLCGPGSHSQSVKWDNNGRSLDEDTQCCGSPYYTVANVYIHARLCDPRSYGTSLDIKRTCWEPQYYQLQTRDVKLRVKLFQPDGSIQTNTYNCTCTLYAPPYVMHSNSVKPGNYILGVTVEEYSPGFVLGPWIRTGHAERVEHFTN